MAGLREFGVSYLPSHANFILMKIGPLHAELCAAMRAHGVLLRDRSTDPGCDGYRPHHNRHRRPRHARPRRSETITRTKLDGCPQDDSPDLKVPHRHHQAQPPPRPRSPSNSPSDGQGVYKVSTGIRFFDHMLELFTRHGGFDLTLACTGDLDVDQHHTVEDVGIALGEAFNEALGDKEGQSSAPVTSSWPWTRPSPSPPSTSRAASPTSSTTK